MCALGTVCIINANIGAAPWDVLHQGISYKSGITIGKANIIMGAIIVLIDTLLGEKIGWGTVLNMIFIGTFIDIISFSNIIQIQSSFIPGIIMLIVGMAFISLGTVLYMQCGLGSGPRDGMMVALNKITKKPILVVRGALESGALIVGIALGGNAGIGTFISALTLGYIMQFIFKICKFDSAKVKHRFIEDDIRYIKSKLNKENEIKENIAESN